MFSECSKFILLPKCSLEDIDNYLSLTTIIDHYIQIIRDFCKLFIMNLVFLLTLLKRFHFLPLLYHNFCITGMFFINIVYLNLTTFIKQGILLHSIVTNFQLVSM